MFTDANFVWQGWPTGLVQQPDPPRLSGLSYLTPGRSRKQQHQQQQHQQLLLEQQQQHLHLLQQQQHQHQQLLQQQQQMYQKQQKQQQQQYMHALSRTESSTEEDLVGKVRDSVTPTLTLPPPLLREPTANSPLPTRTLVRDKGRTPYCLLKLTFGSNSGYDPISAKNTC